MIPTVCRISPVTLDILGTANTVELVTVTPTTENYIWADQPRNTMKLVRSEIATEDESRLFWVSKRLSGGHAVI